MRALAHVKAGFLAIASFTAIGTPQHAAAQAAASFTQAQQIQLQAGGWNQILHYDYSTATSETGSVAFGNRTETYAIRLDAFMGLFLYDFSYTRFSFAYYNYGDRL